MFPVKNINSEPIAEDIFEIKTKQTKSRNIRIWAEPLILNHKIIKSKQFEAIQTQSICFSASSSSSYELWTNSIRIPHPPHSSHTDTNCFNLLYRWLVTGFHFRTCYNANPRPDALMKEQLVEMTGLSPRVIRVWFQNKRCKDKKKTIQMKLQMQQEKVRRHWIDKLHSKYVSHTNHNW